MIRSGKSSKTSWLTLPIESFMPWAELNGVLFNGIHVSSDSTSSDLESPAHGVIGTSDKGHGLVATKELSSASKEPILSVPLDMVLSQARVRQIARGDGKLAELLKACQAMAIVSYDSSSNTTIIKLMY